MAELSERSFPFDSEEVNGVEDRLYLADEFAEYFRSFISSGIFMKKSDNLQVVANGDMTVTLKPGKMIIEGYGYTNMDEIIIPIESADGVLNRIDRIAVTWSLVDRDIHYTLQKGEYSYEPVPPECRRDAEYKDYVVADIHINAGIITVTQENIVDQRLNSNVCGLAVPFAEIDTAELHAQLQSYFKRVMQETEVWKEQEKADILTWFEYIKGQLSGDIAVNLQMQISEFREATEEEIDHIFQEV